MLQILPKLRLAHVTLGHLNNCFSVRLISGYDLVTLLNLPTGKIQREALRGSPFRGRVGGMRAGRVGFLSVESHGVAARTWRRREPA